MQLLDFRSSCVMQWMSRAREFNQSFGAEVLSPIRTARAIGKELEKFHRYCICQIIEMLFRVFSGLHIAEEEASTRNRCCN